MVSAGLGVLTLLVCVPLGCSDDKSASVVFPIPDFVSVNAKKINELAPTKKERE